MTIDEIKQYSLEAYLEAHGFQPVKSYRNIRWFCSPLRQETSASFKVDTDTNLWFDFGLGKGGNIINLVSMMNPQLTMHEVLLRLTEELQGGCHAITPVHAHSSFPTFQPKPHPKKADTTIIIDVVALTHPRLRDYLVERRINIEVGKRFCREIHYKVEGKDSLYYAIAFPNISGGYEARNKYSKRCFGGKDISHVLYKDGEKQSSCCVFEGFFDFLTYATLERYPDIGICIGQPTDYLILNSVVNVHKSFGILKGYEYVHCYLDNDQAGRRATKSILTAFPTSAKDESSRYSQHQDLNDVIIGKPAQH